LPRRLLVAGGLALTLASVGCHLVPPGATVQQRAAAAVPEHLLAPAVSDWSGDRITSSTIALARQAQARRESPEAARRVQAFPTAPAAWTGGLSLQSAFGATATDTVPNGPAAVFTGLPSLANTLFFLSKEGKFIKVNQLTPAVKTVLPLNRVFSRTFVTLSPAGTRAYVLADDGTFFIVDTLTMTVLATRTVAGGYGTAPVLDPYFCNGNDTFDTLYVTGNNGVVSKLTVQAPTAGGAVTVTDGPTYNVATGLAPLYGEVRMVKAPPVVLNGTIFLGDTAGNLQVYDTVTPANSRAYALGAPVVTAPAIEIQDGSYALTDPTGAPKAVGVGMPIYAFVNAGAACAWVDLHGQRVTFSQPLRIDDNSPGTRFGALNTYGFRASTTTQNLVAVDGGNINTEVPAVNLPGVVPARNWSNDLLVPAETNTRGSQGNPAGGPVVSYLRWTAPASATGTDVVNGATLRLWPATSPLSGVPDVFATSHLNVLGTAPWSSDTLTNANRPLILPLNVGTPGVGFTMFGQNAFYNTGNSVTWDVTPAFPLPQRNYALALSQRTGGAQVLWPEGPHTPNILEQLFSTRLDAVKFRNNPLNANPAGYSGVNDQRPILSLAIAATKLPTPSIETPPSIDAINKRVYVITTNALFQVNFQSPATFADAVAGQNHTLFNLAYYGVAAAPANGGAAFNGNAKFVGNTTAPVLNYNLTAAYVVSRYPSPDVAVPTSWRYAVSKFNLPLSATANRLVASSTPIAATARDAGSYMVIDPFTNVWTTGGSVYLGLGDGRIHQFDP
jgi:hypothetical protein